MLTQTDTVLASLLEKSKEMDTHKADFTNRASEHQFNPEAKLVVPAPLWGVQACVAPLEMTEWALGQVCNKLGASVFGKGSAKSLPIDYIQAMKPELRAHVLNEHLTRADNQWFVRAYEQKCRAVLSGGYAAISNTELLELLYNICQNSTAPYSLTKTSSVEPDSMNVRIIWREIDKPGGPWGLGVYVGNGETGNRRGRVLSLLQRGKCENSVMVDKGKGALEFIHRGSSAAKRVMVRAAMAEALPWAAKLLDRMIAAEEENIEDFGTILDGLSIQHGWGDELKTKVAIGTEGKETRAGLVNGITWAAKSLDTPDAIADMEIFGGSILMASDSVFHKAIRVAALKEEKGR